MASSAPSPRPFPAVVGLSVPFGRGAGCADQHHAANCGYAILHAVFQEPGVAETELERDRGRPCAICSTGASGEGAAAIRAPRQAVAAVSTSAWCRERAGCLQVPALRHPARWLSEADIDFYAGDSSARAFAARSLYIAHRSQLGADGAFRIQGSPSGAVLSRRP